MGMTANLLESSVISWSKLESDVSELLEVISFYHSQH